MKCMKEYWDEIHQGLGFLTKRHLREQATRIEKKKNQTHGNIKQPNRNR